LRPRFYGGGHGEHRYTVSLTWTGNLGSGTWVTETILGTMRSAPVIHGSADPAFRGDRSRWDPEELLVASLSAVVSPPRRRSRDHRDRHRAEAVLEVGRDGAGGFKSVVLRPTMTVAAM
jgi:hypothetical protein